MKIPQSDEYWFFLYDLVYVSFEDKTNVLLYNTSNGKRLLNNKKDCIQIVKDIYIPANLGVVKITQQQLTKPEIYSFITQIVEEGFGEIRIIDNLEDKPILLLPILNLQNDIEKMTKDEIDKMNVGSDILNYLSEINIYINNTCFQHCPSCKLSGLQVKSCIKSTAQLNLSPEIIESVLSQIQYSPIKKINILGGNIFLYPYWEKLFFILEKYNFKYNYWINHLNFDPHNPLLSSMDSIHIVISFSLNNKLNELALFAKKRNKITHFHFLIENENHFDGITTIDFDNYSVHPIFNGTNYSFFEKNVFLSEGDLFENVISMRNIFCNQKVNQNYFGFLNIFPNGSVKSSMNTKKIGNIKKDSILNITYSELIKNTSWRSIRNKGRCKHCTYRFICPPPSNYEQIIGKPDLCNIS
ncbi:MAG: TIGR04150 pseudo-rSAM protein [Tannerella sp.]|jgi:pseudo-rSAM protein|nr:TIGR04150 pseudo-rSAM protein [Tannerella sp.]